MTTPLTADEIRAMLQDRADGFGECDRCHHEAPLWDDPETAGAGDFQFCARCWEAYAKRHDWQAAGRRRKQAAADSTLCNLAFGARYR